MKQTTRLRQFFKSTGAIVMPMAYDALSARLIERSGFAVVGITGHGVSASVLGVSDVGLVTQTEMVSQARHIANAVSIPVIADADTGYGNPINMRRTVREFEQAGVAAIYFEDQVAPKKCGHFEGKSVITMEEMIAKIRAASEARRDPDFVLIARTDSLATYGVEAAINRVNAYGEAGADVVYVDAPESEEQVRMIGEQVRPPIMFNQAEGGKTPLFSVEELYDMGFKIISFSNSLMRTAAKAMIILLDELKSTGTTEAYLDKMISFEERNQILGLYEIQNLENRYKTSPS